MTDIELVIKIPEEQYKFIKQSMTMDAVKNYPALLYGICEHIANGTVLPKGHGKLRDLDGISLADINFFSIGDYRKMVRKLANAPTIIEADRSEEEE